MVSLSFSKTKTTQKKTCKCGWPGEVKVGKDWYCTECLDYGDDEDDDDQSDDRLSGVKLC